MNLNVSLPMDPPVSQCATLRHRLKLLFSHLRLALAGNLFNAIAYLYVSWDLVSRPLILAWIIFTALVTGVRVYMAHRWDKMNPDRASLAQLKRYYYYFAVGVAVSGLLWILPGWLYFENYSMAHRSFSLFIAAGMTAGAVAAYSSFFWIAMSFIIPVLSPVLIRALFTPEGVDFSLLAVSGFYIFLLVKVTQTSHRVILSTMMLSFEKQELARRLELSLTSSGAASWTWDVRNNIMDLGEGLDAFRHNGAGLIRTFEDFLSRVMEEDRAALQSEIKTALRREDSYHGTFRVLGSADRVHYIENRARVDRDDNGEPLRMIGILLDVTAKKRQESLEREREIVQAERKAVSRFLANASHEIRTPLSSISGYLDLLEEDAEIRGRPREYLNIVRRNSAHLLSLVNDLLDLSRLHSNQVAVHRQWVALDQEIETVLSMVRAAGESKGIVLRKSYSPFVPDRLYTDSKILRQILVNLLGNAVKFTERGEVVLDVDLAFTAEGAQLRFRVRDTGIGIDPKMIPRLFQPFERGVRPYSQSEQGYGLGLALSSELAKAIGGDLRLVSSELGQGSEFEFSVMLGEAPASIAPSAPLQISDGL